MKFGLMILVVLIPILLGVGVLFWYYLRANVTAEDGWKAIAANAAAVDGGFSTDVVAHLPESVRRYFVHAIAQGTPLKKTVELSMRGTFRLGEKSSAQSYDMEARQILAPPDQFVWIPTMRRGPLHISGSDALVSGQACTRFWINSLVPVANNQTSPDLVRSAQFRSAMEGIWAPAALLPRPGITWSQPSPDVARVTIAAAQAPIVLDLTLSPNGAVREVVGLRWSNENPDKQFRLQPSGALVLSETTFEGFTIPSQVQVGNHFGTQAYFPFFEAQVTAAHYL
jgi:hypothetical protein